MGRALSRDLFVLVLSVAEVASVRAQATPAFDVTSIKPNTSGDNRIRMIPGPNGGWQAINATLGFLVRIVFQLEDKQLVGGPPWLFTYRFDVTGTGTAPGRDGPLQEKVKTLLVDRFQLVMHVEKRELQGYQLVMARKDGALGDKLTASASDCSGEAAPAPAGRGHPSQPLGPDDRPKCGFMTGPGRLLMGGQTISMFAQSLSRLVGGVVVDKTNLPGAYDATLTYTPDPGINPAGRDVPAGVSAAPALTDAPSIFTALQEQLGLKLESTKTPAEVVVIDKAEKPAPD